MDYRILGPLEVWAGDRPVALGGEKQRALLAILLLHANEPVSVDGLIDGVWGERPPATAVKTTQGYIARLRRALDQSEHKTPGSSNEILVTRGHGYLLRVSPGELDIDRFRALVEQGRRALAAGEAKQAARVLRAGLELWRGLPLADFTYEPFAQAAIAQAEELRLAAIEERVEADLALGRHGELVGELQALVEQHPLRERLRAELMLALYRCRRQAEALQTFQEYRRALSERLGLDPSPALRQLEASILNRDPSLEPGSGNGGPTGITEPSPVPARESVNRQRRLAVGMLAVVALVLAAVVGASSLGGAAARSLLDADSVGALRPSSGAVSADVPVASSPSAMASGATALWVSNYNAGTVSRIDPTTRALVETIPAGETPSGIAVGAGAAWVANYIVGTVSRINPTVNRVVQTIRVGNGPTGVAVGFGSVWVTNSSDGTLTRINAVTGVPDKRIALGGDPTGVAVGFGAVWVSDAVDSRVLEIDPSTNQVTQPIDVGAGPGAIAVGYDSVWVANTLDETVSRINPQTSEVTAAIPVGDQPDAVAAGAGGVWVANEFGNSVARIDPATDSAARTIAVANPPTALAISNGLVWAGVRASTAVHRGGTLVVLQNAPFGSFEPYGPGSIASFLTQVVTTDGLTAFKRVGGSDGDEVVPDLAVSLPTPTDGGRTYTFRVRSGVRYSSGQPVRPEDFRRAAQRALIAGDNFDFENLVGASACAARPSRCDLSQSIVTDDTSGTITFHLAIPDPDFFAKLAQPDAAAVAPGTPSQDIDAHPLPATGPYKVVSVTPRQVVLARNPYFHEWSHAAQPDGYPDRIVWRTGASVDTAITEVERGEADYTLDPPPQASLAAIETRLPSQLRVTLDDVTIQLALNTRAAPFNDVRVRRALSYAVNREKIARLLGQDSQPTCQWLPPDALGYKPYCPYTLNPVGAGTWSAPNLGAARRLIAASGTRGTPITIWSGPGYSTPDFTPAARYLASVLNQLGYPTRVKTFSVQGNMYRQVFKPGSKFQAFDRVNVPTFPAPSQFLGPDFTGCSGNYNFYKFCDPQTDAIVRAALAAQAAESPAAATLWANADRALTGQAPAVNLVTPSVTDFVSRRVGNYQYNPQLGVLLDQLWVR
jgi:peptide/nickel transport system substrate-binding protein